MPVTYYKTSKHPICTNLVRANITKADLCRLIQVERPTLDRFFQRPGLMRIEQLLIMSSIFNMTPEDLLGELIRGKVNVHKKGKWYIEDIRERNK